MAPPASGALCVTLALACGCSADLETRPMGPAPPCETGGAASSSDVSAAGSGGARTAGAGPGGAGGTTDGEPPATELDQRVVDYGEAARTASLKLAGDLPDLDAILSLQAAADPAAAYESFVDALLADPRFAGQMVAFWRNVFRVTEDDPSVSAPDAPVRDSAALFAAWLVVEGEPLTELFTATADTCPSWDAATGAFAEGHCKNTSETTGVLTDPGLLTTHHGNLAFRRVRLFQEAFSCRSALEPPIELADPLPDGGACAAPLPPAHDSPWHPDTIAGECNGGPIDFHAFDSTTACASCHGTFNHRAPLWGGFDALGVESAQFAVRTPIAGYPLSQATDWLPDGEPPAWRFGSYVETLADLGNAMAADDDVRRCFVARVWGWALSHGDPSRDGLIVPDEVVAELAIDFEASGYDLASVIRAVFLHEDFVRF